jgi:hypothetical protein
MCKSPSARSTEHVLMRGAAKPDASEIKKHFNTYRKLNQKARVIVAHGS